MTPVAQTPPSPGEPAGGSTEQQEQEEEEEARQEEPAAQAAPNLNSAKAEAKLLKALDYLVAIGAGRARPCLQYGRAAPTLGETKVAVVVNATLGAAEGNAVQVFTNGNAKPQLALTTVLGQLACVSGSFN